jgi:hypothetical protein
MRFRFVTVRQQWVTFDRDKMSGTYKCKMLRCGEGRRTRLEAGEGRADVAKGFARSAVRRLRGDQLGITAAGGRLGILIDRERAANEEASLALRDSDPNSSRATTSVSSVSARGDGPAIRVAAVGLFFGVFMPGELPSNPTARTRPVDASSNNCDYCGIVLGLITRRIWRADKEMWPNIPFLAVGGRACALRAPSRRRRLRANRITMMRRIGDQTRATERNRTNRCIRRSLGSK